MEQTKPSNFIQSLYPSTKFMFTILILIVSAIYPDYRVSFLLFGVDLLYALLAGIFPQTIRSFVKFFLPLTLAILIFQSLFYPGETIIWRWGIFHISQEGLDYALLLDSKILAIGTAFTVFFQSTDMKDIVFALQKSGLSAKASYVILSVFTIIPELRDKAMTIQEAQKSRGVETEGNLWIRTKALMPVVTPLVVGAINDTEEKVITLESRGFSVEGPKTSLYQISKHAQDYIITVLEIAVLIAIIIWRFV